MPYILENNLYNTFGGVKYLHVELNVSVVNLHLQITGSSGFYIGLPKAFKNGVDITTLPANLGDLKVTIEAVERGKLTNLISKTTMHVISVKIVPSTQVSTITIDMLPRKDDKLSFNSQILQDVKY